MSESYDPKLDSGVPEENDDGVLSEGDESTDSDSPRRAASAEFIVSSEVGAATALRDAMDPAHQSLTDALRLSFRVLQFVILVLIVLFLGSGIITVQDKESGVLTRWGKIVPYQGRKDLGSGLKHSWWPYPVSEFVLFEVENLTVEIKDTFLPNNIVRSKSIQQLIDTIRESDRFRDGVDGALLTADGDIAHVAVNVSYEIEDPVKFVENIVIDQGDNIVRWATERAMINAVATTTLKELMEITEDVRERIQVGAQLALDEIGCGIRIRQVQMAEPPRPPYTILNTFTELQEAGVMGEQQLQTARNGAEEIRSRTAGADWRTFINLIEQYEDTLDLSDDETAEQLLTAINDWLDNKAAGSVSSIISAANSYQSTIDSTLGNEAKRFASLLPAFRESPELVIRQLWDEARSNVLSQVTSETYYVPAGLGRMNIILSGLDEIKQKRRDRKLDRRNSQGWIEGLDLMSPYIKQSQDIRMSGPGRQLDIKDGKVIGQGAARDSNSGN